MPDEPAVKNPRSSRRIYWMWGTALTILLALGLFCWLVVPVWQTCKAVERCCPPLPSVAGEESWDARVSREIRSLGGPQKAASRLSVYLRLPERLASKKSWALGMLVKCEGPGVRGLVEALNHGDREVRWKAAEYLGYQGFGTAAEDAVDPLITKLRSSDHAEVRNAAALALGRIRTRAAMRALAAALYDMEVSSAAGHALEGPDPAKLKAECKTLLSDEDPRLRLFAAFILAQYPDAARLAVPTLAALLRNASRDMQLEVIYLLGQSGQEARSAVPELEKLLQSKDESIRQASASALKEIKAAQEKGKSQ